MALGAQLHLVRPLGFSLSDRQVRRAGMDYWADVDPQVHEDFAAFEQALPSLGTPLFFSREGERTLYEVDIAKDAVFVFGQESVGFDAAIRESYADRLVRLPIPNDRVRSINLSTCVAVVLYEALRRA